MLWGYFIEMQDEQPELYIEKMRRIYGNPRTLTMDDIGSVSKSVSIKMSSGYSKTHF